jgi:hypothetical protein
VYNLILIIVNKFIKIAYYILINATINVAKLIKVFMNIIFKDYKALINITFN